MARRHRGVDGAPDDAAPPTFGRLLRRYRRERGLTQEQLAEGSGISVRAIGDLERGVKHRPREATVELLADALRLSDSQRSALRATASQFRETGRGWRPRDGAHLPLVAVQPTYHLPAPGPLVGRQDVLDSVLDAFPDQHVPPSGVPGNDRPRLLLIAGDAGMGKTRMLAEIARHAQERGLLLLAGGSFEAEGRLPLGALHDALLDYIDAQADEVLRTQLGGLLSELARVIPELRDRFPNLPTEHVAHLEQHRPRIFWTLASALKRISQSQPLVLLLDDLQWSDETTVELLHYLTRQPQLNQMLVVGAYRPGETSISADLDQLLARRPREPWLSRADLQPMDLAELAAVLDAHLGGGYAAELTCAVHERSGGNPFFALEIIGLLRQQGQLEEVSGESGDIWILKEGMEIDLPAAVRETVAQRLKGLDPQVLEVLQLAAVVGRPVAYMTLAELWEGKERSLLRALDAALSVQILEETERGYAFPHPVLQEVVCRGLSAAHRAWLHARVAQSLEDMYGTRADEHAGELAHHVVAGGRDRERALHYLTLTGDASAQASAFQEALTAYLSALQYASTDRSVGDIQERIGGVLKALGRYDDALIALEEALERFERAGDIERVGAVAAALVQVHALRGSWEQGRAHATQVISQIEPLRPWNGGLAGALVDLHLALTYLYDAGLEAQLRAAERAAEIAWSLGDDGLLARAEMRRGFLLYALRRFTEAQEVIRTLIPVAERVRDTSTLRFAVDILADIDKLQGRFQQCLQGREQALGYAEERPDEPHWIMVSLAQLGEARFLLGDWREARALYERAVQMSRVYPAPHYAAFALLGLAALNLAEGRWEEATELIETCIADAQRTHDVHWVRNAERLLALRDLLRGEPDEALRGLQDDGEDHTGTLYLRAWGYLETGDVQRATTTIGRAIALTSERNNSLDLCEASIVRGRIDWRQGCVEDAEDSFSKAVSLARSMPYPYAEARALYEWGIMDSQRGAYTQAQERLAEAREILQRLDAQPYLSRLT